MKKFGKKLSLLLVAGISVFVLAACGKQAETKTPGTLTVGLEGTYAPFGYRNNKGKLTGFDVDVATDVAKKMGMKVSFKPTTWDSLIGGLKAGTFDVIFNDMAVRKNREKDFRYATPYAYSGSVLITRKGSSIKTLKDIKGKKFGASTGSDYYNRAQKLGATVVPVPDFQTEMDMIQQGRLDAALNSQAAFNFWKQSHKDANVQDQEVPSSVIPQDSIAPILNIKSKKLQKQMDKAINELRQDGTLKRLSIKYFGKNITNK